MEGYFQGSIGVVSPPADGIRSAVQHGNADRKDAASCIFPAAAACTCVIKYWFAAMLHRSTLGILIIPNFRRVLISLYVFFVFERCCRSQHQSSIPLHCMTLVWPVRFSGSFGTWC